MHHGEHRHLIAEALLVEQRPIALDVTRLLQRAHTAQARRRRNTDSVRQLDVGDSPVVLQLLEDLAVDGIKSCGQFRPPLARPALYYPCTRLRETILRINGILVGSITNPCLLLCETCIAR